MPPSTPRTIRQLTALWEPNFMNIFTSSATDRGQAWDLNLMACNVPNVPPDILRWEALETVWKLPWWLLPPPPCRKSVVHPLMAISVCCLDSLRGNACKSDRTFPCWLRFIHLPVTHHVLQCVSATVPFPVVVHTSACHPPHPPSASASACFSLCAPACKLMS